MEYIYIISGENKYEAYQELKADSIFQDMETFERSKNSGFLEGFSYDEAIYYRAAMLANSIGRVVGDKAREQDVFISMPTGTGLWTLCEYENEFGDKTGQHYLVISGKGHFSNSATTGSLATICIFVDINDVTFRLIEYNDYIVKDDEKCYMKIKDSEGEVHEFTLYNSRNGQMKIYNGYGINKILEKGGIITISAEKGRYSKSNYLFKVDVTGYNKAYEYIINDSYFNDYKLKNKNFLKNNALQNDVVVLPSGVQYKVIKEGNGIMPTNSSRVKCHYEGRLIDGTIFDNSRYRDETFEVNLANPRVIPGWVEVLKLMPEGSKWEVYIPQEQAYGGKSMYDIKPFSTLIFTIEIIKIIN